MLTIKSQTEGRTFDSVVGTVKFVASAAKDTATAKIDSYTAEIQINIGTEKAPVFETVGNTRMSGREASTSFSPSKAEYAGVVYAAMAQFLLDMAAAFVPAV